MKVYYNLKSKTFYTDRVYNGERVYIADKENSFNIVTSIAFCRSWFAKASDTSDSHLPCELLRLFCDYLELTDDLIVYTINKSRLSSSEFTIKYNSKSHSFIPISGGFSFNSERVGIKFNEVTHCLKSDDVDFISLGVRELKDIHDEGETRKVLEKLFQLSNTIMVDENTGTIDFTFNNEKESELLFFGD